MDDIYPRFNVYTHVKFNEGECIAYRVSEKRAAALLASFGNAWMRRRVEVSRPRFRIKVATWPTRSPIVLYDRSRPAFRGHYRTLGDACRAMDNIVRRERNMPARLAISTDEIREAMVARERRIDNLLGGRTAAVRVVTARPEVLMRRGAQR